MGWISDRSEYARQREALRRRTNWESADGLPNLSWEIAEILDPHHGFEPEALTRPEAPPKRSRRTRHA